MPAFKSYANIEQFGDIAVTKDTKLDDIRPRRKMRVIYEDFNCPYCYSGDVVRYGKYKGVQRWWCNTCGHKFADNEAIFHMRTPIREIAEALDNYYGGKSINSIRQGLQQQHNHYPSESTIYRWLVRFTKQAIEHIEKHKPNVGDVWVADETVLKIGGRQLWFWDIIDAKTRFLLASHISVHRGAKDAQILMQKARDRAGKSPRMILTDKLGSYIDGIELTFGADTKHVQSKPFVKIGSTNLIERFHGTLKDRTEIMRGLKSESTARLILDGWLIHYNYFRVHDTLRTTPAEKAGIKLSVANWLDVVKSEAKEHEIKIDRPALTSLGILARDMKIRPKRKPRPRKRHRGQQKKQGQTVISITSKKGW